MTITVTVASSTKTTHPTTMPTMQPVEHPRPESDGAGLTFTVASGSVLWELESTSIVSAVDVDIVTVVVGSENKN